MKDKSLMNYLKGLTKEDIPKIFPELFETRTTPQRITVDYSWLLNPVIERQAEVYEKSSRFAGLVKTHINHRITLRTKAVNHQQLLLTDIFDTEILSYKNLCEGNKIKADIYMELTKTKYSNRLSSLMEQEDIEEQSILVFAEIMKTYDFMYKRISKVVELFGEINLDKLLKN